MIKAEVRFEGGAQIITADSATLDITQVTGDPGFLSVTSLKLPVREVTDENLTAQLPVDSNGDTQGTLFATVVFDAVKIVPADSDPAFAYAYDGVGETGGVIGYILTYTPPPIVGDYRATVTVKTDQTVTASTNFSVLPGLKIFALATLYPRSDTEALPGDLVILQVDLTNTDVEDIASASVSGELVPEALSMAAASKFHPALREKWEVDPNAKLLLPFSVLRDAVPGQASPTVTAVDIAGQIFTTSATTTPATSPVVEVASTPSTFNVYLLPRFSFIAPPLECAASTALCTGDEDHEFDINELLQQTVPRSKLNPAFLALIPAVLGPVPLSELVDTIFGYNTAVTPPRFTAFTTSVVLARIHRRTSLGTALEEASGCSSESGIMVLEQKPARKQGAPNRCCHRTNPTVSASSLTTIAWWPMPACSCRPP